MQPDDIQQLLLRYFAITTFGADRFGKPSIAQQGLETMKRLNKEMDGWEAAESLQNSKGLIEPLEVALELITEIFHENEPFRRVQPLIIKGETQENLKKVWKDSTKVNPAIFTCLVCCFSRLEIRKRRLDIIENGDVFRSAIIDTMQTDPSFTDSLALPTTSKRIKAMETTIDECLKTITDKFSHSRPVPRQTRVDLIASATRASKNPECPLCGRPLGPFEDHLHIDHVIPRSQGGTNALDNLQVVHKTCNLRKSDKTAP